MYNLYIHQYELWRRLNEASLLERSPWRKESVGTLTVQFELRAKMA